MQTFKEWLSEEKQRLDPKCWDGYKKKGTKMKGDTRVNDCVKEEELDEKVKDMDMGEVIKDFQKSDAPQFKGKSKEKKREMAIAAKLSADEANDMENEEIISENPIIAGAARAIGSRYAAKKGAGKVGQAVAGQAASKAASSLTSKKVNEGIDKTIARHESGIRQANAAMKTASSNQQMVKHMNALTHHKKALKTAMMRQSMQEEGIKSGHKRPTEDGAGLTQKGVDAHRRENPGSKLQTAVTTPPSKLKAGSKAAKRRKSFCARSGSWTGERGKAARKRWNC